MVKFCFIGLPPAFFSKSSNKEQCLTYFATDPIFIENRPIKVTRLEVPGEQYFISALF
jgi:hypothetical protein